MNAFADKNGQFKITLCQFLLFLSQICMFVCVVSKNNCR